MQSTAVVTIERPARYGKQLASHLGHKINVTEINPVGWHFDIETAVADVIPSETTLTMAVTADDAESLERMKFVLQKHLLKFTGDLNPEVIWK